MAQPGGRSYGFVSRVEFVTKVLYLCLEQDQGLAGGELRASEEGRAAVEGLAMSFRTGRPYCRVRMGVSLRKRKGRAKAVRFFAEGFVAFELGHPGKLGVGLTWGGCTAGGRPRAAAGGVPLAASASLRKPGGQANQMRPITGSGPRAIA